jgi:hypothetical protein
LLFTVIVSVEDALPSDVESLLAKLPVVVFDVDETVKRKRGRPRKEAKEPPQELTETGETIYV